jgi:hypothetical protein
MSSWLTSVVSKLTGMLASKPPSAHVCVFGKHPGWNDHIDDLGLDSEPLVAAKQELYVHGIGGVIDSGKWENPPPDDQVLGFRHVFLWRDATNLIFGRLWDSRDGKNRTKYPMVVCVHLANRTKPGIPDPMPLLDELELACRKAATAEDVHSIVAGARAKAAALLEAPAAQPLHKPEFAQQIGMGSEGEASTRVAYAAESSLGWMRNGPSAAIDLKLAQSKIQPQHIRFPADAQRPFASILFWQSFFQKTLPDTVPQFYLVSLDAPWLDLIVGPLTARHLACIRGGEKSFPPANSIPFNITDADQEAARKRWAAFLES